MKLNKLRLVFAALAVVFMIAAGLYASYNVKTNYNGVLSIKTVEGKVYEFKVELADSPEKWAVGLMKRRSMPENDGMLFIMNEGIQTFWMKNTYIPLDMLFIDKNGIVKHIQKNAKPESLDYISSEVAVTGVLEINGGLSDKLNIKIGDKAEYKF